MGSSCCSFANSKEIDRIEAATKCTNQFPSAVGPKNNSIVLNSENNSLQLNTNRGNEKKISIPQEKQSTIEKKMKEFSSREERKIEEELKALSERNERINKEREAKRLVREQNRQNKLEKGLPLSDSDSERTKNRKQTIQRLREAIQENKKASIRRSITFNYQEHNIMSSDEENFNIEKEEMNSGSSKYRFLRQSTHRNAVPKKGLLKRSKTSFKHTGKKVKFGNEKIKILK